MSIDTAVKTKRVPVREPMREFAPEKSPARPIVKTLADGSLVATLPDGTEIMMGGNKQDKFSIDPMLIPDGWSYEWRNYTVLGQLQHEDSNDDYRNGWRPVPADRHPELFSSRDGTGSIIMSGSILCERPIEFTNKANRDERDRYRASEQRQRQQFGIHSPAFDTSDPRVRPTINKTVERAPDKLIPIE